MAQLASVLAWGASGRPFESGHPDDQTKGALCPFFVMHMFYTYILFSEKLGVYYTGSSQNLEFRLREHNRGKTAFAAKGAPWTLVLSKAFHTRAEAMALERKIKKRGAQRFLIDLDLNVG